jgi:hypothetical protein
MRWVVGSAGVGYCCGNLAPHSQRFAMLYAVIKALLSGIVIAVSAKIHRLGNFGVSLIGVAIYVSDGCLLVSTTLKPPSMA